MVVLPVMSRPLRGCSTTTKGPRLIARSTVRTAARTTSCTTPVSVGRCSGCRNNIVIVVLNFLQWFEVLSLRLAKTKLFDYNFVPMCFHNLDYVKDIGWYLSSAVQSIF